MKFRATFEVEAFHLTPLTIEAAEEFVGGDAGACGHLEHTGCLVFAAKQGALHATMKDWLVKSPDGAVQSVDPTTFTLHFTPVANEGSDAP